MRKEILIEKIQGLSKNHIKVRDVFNLYIKEDYDNFMKELKFQIEKEFNISDLGKKVRDTEYVVARSCFFHLCKLRSIPLCKAHRFVNLSHSTGIHAQNKFEEYQTYYKEYDEPIKNMLAWYFEYNCKE